VAARTESYFASPWEKAWGLQLEKREMQETLRSLRPVPEGWADFCSNDFLGLARSPLPKGLLAELQTMPSGGSGSRLISGSYEVVMELEDYAAELYGAEAGLFFGSGYAANQTLLTSITGRGDTILLDENSHASLREGARASIAAAYTFSHNNLAELEIKLQRLEMKKAGNVFVVVESLYSMTGTFAPLAALVDICNRFNACLVVDEAHSTGLLGPGGRGMVAAAGLETKVPIRIMTFGKAVGAQGAIVLGTRKQKAMLVNFGRPFIYTTATMPIVAMLVRHRLEQIANDGALRAAAMTIVDSFYSKWNNAMEGKTGLNIANGAEPRSPIMIVKANGGREVLKGIVAALAAEKMWAKAILAPTVAEADECIRLTLHSHNTDMELTTLVQVLAKFAQ